MARIEKRAPQEEMTPQGEMAPPEGAPQEGGNVDKKLQKELNRYMGAVSKILHGKTSKNKVYEMLKSAPPEKSIPQANFHINKVIYEKLKEGGKTPSLEVMFGGTMFAVSELAEIGNAGGFFEKELSKDNMQPIVQDTLQLMIEEGVRANMIDPIELQQKVEPLLNEQQQSMGLEMAQRTGVSPTAGQNQAMEKYAMDRVNKEKQMMASRQAAQNTQKGQLNRASQQGGQ